MHYNIKELRIQQMYECFLSPDLYRPMHKDLDSG